MLPLPAIHALIDLSRGYSKVFFGLHIPLPSSPLPNPPLQLSPSRVPSTRCKRGFGVQAQKICENIDARIGEFSCILGSDQGLNCQKISAGGVDICLFIVIVITHR
jgi:hypothetical protein